MLDIAKDKYEELRERLEEYGSRDEPDGRNVGISRTEAGVALAAALGATFITRRLLQSGWKAALDRDPPKNPASHEVDWADALMWGAISGAVVGITRIVSRRGASSVYRRF